jgi:hypothetical protein
MAIIDKPSDYFNTVIYTGNGAAARGITGVGFQPDWVWVKDRSVGYPHITWDSARTNKASLCTNTTAAEVTTTARTLTSFDSDGFTTPNVTDDIFNDNGTAFVSWNWKAGGTASSNTDGSITSSVSANQDAGFSIVSYTGNGTAGATVGHGLSSKPGMMIFKERNGVTGWVVYHHKNTSAPATEYLQLNTDAATADYADYFNDTEPTSSVFTLGNDTGINQNTDTYIAYCFAEKQGYSKFGSYTGNGDADGTFVYTGFKPAFVMIKRSDSSPYYWNVLDNKRDTYNPEKLTLFPNVDEVEYNYTNFADFLSNGFKLRFTGAGANASGGTYIYMAFAENPFVSSTGVPATAR